MTLTFRRLRRKRRKRYQWISYVLCRFFVTHTYKLTPYNTHTQAEDGSGTSTPITGDALTDDFSELKRKKKSKKKAAMDLEAFERELGETERAADADGDGGVDVDEGDLGDDPFARGEGEHAGLEPGSEPWLGSDRDYLYPEVRVYAYTTVEK